MPSVHGPAGWHGCQRRDEGIQGGGQPDDRGITAEFQNAVRNQEASAGIGSVEGGDGQAEVYKPRAVRGTRSSWCG